MDFYEEEGQHTPDELPPSLMISQFVAPKQSEEVYTRASVKLIQTKEYSNVNKISDHDHLTDDNWHIWKEQVQRVFVNCDIAKYVTGTEECPDETVDPVGICNWNKHGTWAQQVIIQNVTALQMNHVSLKTSAQTMYLVLSVTHDNMAHQMVNHIQNQLYKMKMHAGEDLKMLCNHINKFPNVEFHVLDT